MCFEIMNLSPNHIKAHEIMIMAERSTMRKAFSYHDVIVGLHWILGGVLLYLHPSGHTTHNDVIIASKRRRDVVLM